MFAIPCRLPTMDTSGAIFLPLLLSKEQEGGGVKEDPERQKMKYVSNYLLFIIEKKGKIQGQD